MSGRVVLVAVDASDNAKNAFHYYLENVYRPDDVITIFHCPETPNLNFLSFKEGGLHPPFEEWQAAMTDAREKITKLEADYRLTLQQKSILKMTFVDKEAKKPGEAILKAAEEVKANLIVVGTRGLGAFKRAFLGSVSEQVIRESTVPVLMVPSTK